jgi:phenylacetate-CoA ligase
MADHPAGHAGYYEYHPDDPMTDGLKKIPLLRKIRAVLPESFSAYYRDYVRVREAIRISRHYPENQWRDYQYEKIRSLILLCWERLEGYRNHWENGGFHPDHFRSPDDLSRIPPITKEIIRKNPDAFTDPKSVRKTLHKTGGSTGTPFQFYEPANAGIIEKAFIHEIWSRFYPEISLKTRSTMIRGKIFKGGILFDPMLGLYLSTFKITPDVVRTYLRAIENYRTPLLHAYPSSLYFMARIMKQHGMKTGHAFRAIMLGSEKLYDFQAETIREVFNAPICHWYGQAEKVVLGGNRPGDSFFYLEPLYGYTEILREDGTPAAEGESGEIVGTGFWNTVTPFIRYRTRDLAEFAVSSRPAVKSGYGGLQTVQGRMQDVVVSRSGALLSLVTLANVVAQFDEIDVFRFIQEEPGCLRFLFTPAAGKEFGGPGRMQESIREALGDEFRVELEESHEISPSPAGKNTYLEQRMNLEEFLK